MPCTGRPRQPLLGPWPPYEWRQAVEEKNRFPYLTLRSELMQALQAIHQAADDRAFPAAPPREILDLLNDVGPHLDDRALPVIEGLLDAMWREGLIGAVPPPTPHHPTRYLSPGAAMRAITCGAPVILWPMRFEKDVAGPGSPPASATIERNETPNAPLMGRED